MRSPSTPTSNRRDRRLAARRTRRRPVTTAGVLLVGTVAAAALTGTAPAAIASPADLSAATFSLASTTTPTALTADRGPEVALARAAETTAADSLKAAAAVQSDISTSGLDIGQPATIDTSALEHATDRLQSASVLPDTFLPDLADDVTAATATIDQRVAELRGSFDAAVAKKVEEEAAEKARQEAEAAAAAAAKATEEEAAATTTSSSSSSSGGGSSAPFATGGGSGDNSPAGAQATARGMLSDRGWGDDQFSCLVSLWNKESGWNYQAYNSSSGAFGIPQALPGSKMSSAGADWQTNATTQISWGLGYISGRYGDPCGAWGHSQSTGWY
ncbi:lytic transglycosylase domain-containing protein [Microbacterium sp. VKM Ac-2923]|uniref:aggregation-promoting factor C-terminal-like domain-containing protein n=1 Tax=Microbacterium sp. VKM Ac-2923 TaxID=2929476 RepID=UPI001FB49553|nr:lytic transglycosylase domain-containing protein [Microbacterium sp. VKM Ac-2923]MCJ1707897.1 lytic transglycosylase domain-containing protein [Microbacterium sp. VKM Ac-2923]